MEIHWKDLSERDMMITLIFKNFFGYNEKNGLELGMRSRYRIIKGDLLNGFQK